MEERHGKEVLIEQSSSKNFLPFGKHLILGTFVERPQRFLASVSLEDGQEVVAYCANPGSFGTFLRSGSEVVLQDSGDSLRRRRYTLKAIRVGTTWVGIDTHLANPLAEIALSSGLIPIDAPILSYQREVRTTAGCRLDFLLRGKEYDTYLEVKSAMVVDAGVARFPDSITPRGVKHLRELSRLASEGIRASLLFVVQRDDAHSLAVVSDKDPVYAEEFKLARAAGVAAFAMGCMVDTNGIHIQRLLEIH